MSKRVPEVNVPSRDEQLDFLRKMLAGNRAFAACRGRLGGGFPFDLIESSNSPSHFNAEWREMAGKVRIMGNQLAIFRRNGWNDAYEVLKNALTENSYLMPGETVPIQETTPFTLVILDPDKTFIFINWLINSDPLEIDWYMEEAYNNVIDLNHSSSNETKKLFTAFPSLANHVFQRKKHLPYPGTDFREAFREDVLKKFGDISILRNPVKAFSLMPWQWNDNVEHILEIPFAFLAKGQAKNILGQFDRKMLDKISTWSFDVPNVCLDNNYIGFHLENEHRKWSEEIPGMASRNISRGYGVVLFPELEPRLFGREYMVSHQGHYHYNVEGRAPRFILSASSFAEF